MKSVKVDELTGGEYLAKPVITENGQKLFYEGTCVHPMQIDRLKENGILEVSIFEEDLIKQEPKEIIQEAVQADCQKKIKTILDNYVCKDNESLREIEKTAEVIIEDIFQNSVIAEKVYDIKERSADLYDHAITVSGLSVITAIKMNIDKNIVHSIGVGALLHDLGLKYISVEYRDREPNDFTPDNLFEFRKHTVYGFSSVEKESWMSSAAKKIILFHHERLNGTGYPLKQTMIPPEVRIVSVCDAFDDMICGIGHKQVHVPDAIEHLKKYKDVYYDGRIVDIFLQFVATYPVGTVVQLTTGEQAIVVEQNEHFADSPIVRLLKDVNGNDYKKEKTVNLAESREIGIEKVLKAEE
ncbi:MAG: HD domain-containing protein [Lachnospiraceae bacterium]|nr:HD domain-containing protein [Lachnospiraceae bacterium]